MDQTYYIRRIMVDHVKPEPKFELIDSDGLFSGLRPQYVAREVKKTPRSVP
jgi:hypothetical protein